MKLKISSLILSLLLAFGFVALAISRTASADGEGLKIGETIKTFKVADTGGAEMTFEKLKGDKGTVVIFLSSKCPIAAAYNERVNQLAADYKSKGINVIGLNANSTELLADVKKHAETNYKFSLLIDKNNVVADQFGATVTPEAFFFDANGKLVYRGRIDNDKSGANITENSLRDAVDQTLAGKAVTKTEAGAFGCGIKRIS